MMFWMKTKLATIVIAAVAVATIGGATAVLASQNHSSPSSASAPHSSAGDATEQAGENQGENEFEAQGVIQQVTFDQGTTQSGSLVFLPNGKQATVTVTFTTSTKIEIAGDNSGSGHEDGANEGTPTVEPTSQPATLAAGMNAKVEGTMQSDGTILAKEIQAGNEASDDNDNNGDNNDQGDHTLVGVIQSVDQNAQTFVLLPDGQTATVTIAFDAKTNIEDEHDGGNNAGLASGAHVSVEVITRSDGSFYAKEIKPAGNGDNSGDNGGNNGGNNGQPTPTPGSGGNGGNGGGDDSGH